MFRTRLALVGTLLAGCFSIIPSALWGNAFTISTTLPADLQPVSSVFSKYVEVFGLRVLATSGVSDAKVLHTANVLAEYLDNDENGLIDQAEVLSSLIGSSNSTISTMVLFASQNEQDSLDSSLAQFESIMTRTQNLFGDEIFENGSQGENRDATLEEVLHLVTDKGWDEAFPSVWGEKKGSSIANAMDIARGDISNPSPPLIPPMHGTLTMIKPPTMPRKSPNTSIGPRRPIWVARIGLNGCMPTSHPSGNRSLRPTSTQPIQPSFRSSPLRVINSQLPDFPMATIRGEASGRKPPSLRRAVGKTVLGSAIFTIREAIGSIISILDGSTQLNPARMEFGYTIRATAGCGPTPPPIHGFTFIPFPAGDTFSSAKAFIKLILALGQRLRVSRSKLRETQTRATHFKPDMEMKTMQPYGV